MIQLDELGLAESEIRPEIERVRVEGLEGSLGLHDQPLQSSPFLGLFLRDPTLGDGVELYRSVG